MDLSLDLEVIINNVIYFEKELIKVLVRTITGIFKRPIQEMKNPNSICCGRINKRNLWSNL